MILWFLWRGFNNDDFLFILNFNLITFSNAVVIYIVIESLFFILNQLFTVIVNKFSWLWWCGWRITWGVIYIVAQKSLGISDYFILEMSFPIFIVNNISLIRYLICVFWFCDIFFVGLDDCWKYLWIKFEWALGFKHYFFNDSSHIFHFV